MLLDWREWGLCCVGDLYIDNKFSSKLIIASLSRIVTALPSSQAFTYGSVTQNLNQ